jgi:hypothetical protein
MSEQARQTDKKWRVVGENDSFRLQHDDGRSLWTWTQAAEYLTQLERSVIERPAQIEHVHFPAEVTTEKSGRGVDVRAQCRCGAALQPIWRIAQ